MAEKRVGWQACRKLNPLTVESQFVQISCPGQGWEPHDHLPHPLRPAHRVGPPHAAPAGMQGRRAAARPRDHRLFLS